LNLLVIEANKKICQWFQSALDTIPLAYKTVDNLMNLKELLRAGEFDVIILGLPVAGFSRFEAIQSVANAAPDIPVVILVDTDSDLEVLESIKNGAQGFIRFGTLGSNLINSVLHQAYEHQKAIHSVKESQRMLANLVSNLPGFVYRCRNDEYWTMEYLSDGFMGLTGYSPEDFIQNKKNTFEEIIHPEDRKRIREQIQMAIKKGSHFQLEYRILTADKKEKWVWEQGNAPIGDAADALLEGFITDITEKKYHENQLRMMISIGEILSNVTRFSDFSHIILGKVKDLYKTGQTAILICDPNTGQFKVEAATGKWEKFIDREIFVDTPPYSSAFQKKQVVLIDRETIKKPVLAKDDFLFQAGRYLAVIPLIAQNKNAGLVIVGREIEFSQQDSDVVRTVAEMIATAIERANLYQKTDKQLKHLESLHAIDQAITAVFDIQVVNKIILDQACKELEVDAADILILNAPANILEYSGARGFIDQMIGSIRVPLTTSVAGKVLLENQEFAIPNLEENPLWFIRKNMQVENFKAYFARPLSIKGKAIGVMEVFLRKPFFPDDDWENFFTSLATQAAVAFDSYRKYSDLQKMQQNMASSLRSTFETWSKSLELHDIETHGHMRRVTNNTLRLAKRMGIDEEELPNIERGALLHDIGKLAIMDDILQKKGALTDDEWKEIKRHPDISRELLSNVKLLEDALDIPYSHHENWDGSGYPQGLKGEAIPLAARIFAVVETYDALISPRPYREAWGKKQVIQYLIDQKGKKFDPGVVDLFLDLQKESKNQ